MKRFTGISYTSGDNDNTFSSTVLWHNSRKSKDLATLVLLAFWDNNIFIDHCYLNTPFSVNWIQKSSKISLFYWLEYRRFSYHSPQHFQYYRYHLDFLFSSLQQKRNGSQIVFPFRFNDLNLFLILLISLHNQFVSSPICMLIPIYILKQVQRLI